MSTTGLAGLVILGTNAETFLLTREERKELIVTARRAVGPHFPLMAGVGKNVTLNCKFSIKGRWSINLKHKSFRLDLHQNG
jgi:hypothetical protein